MGHNWYSTPRGRETGRLFTHLSRPTGCILTASFTILQILKLTTRRSYLPRSCRHHIHRIQSPRGQILMGNLGKGGVSKIYSSLVNNCPSSLDPFRHRWETWLGPMEDEDWRDALMSPQLISISARLLLVKLYYLHYAYLTPTLLHRAALLATPAYPRCRSELADFFHMVWACTHLTLYWETLVSELSNLLGWEVPLNPLTAPGSHGWVPDR